MKRKGDRRRPEDTSFTHTLIECSWWRPTKPSPACSILRSFRSSAGPPRAGPGRLRAPATFVQVSGTSCQDAGSQGDPDALAAVKGKPEAFAINLAVLKSLTRAVYSPEPVGITPWPRALLPLHVADPALRRPDHPSPARRLFRSARHRQRRHSRGGRKRAKIDPDTVPSFDDLVKSAVISPSTNAAPTTPNANCDRSSSLSFSRTTSRRLYRRRHGITNFGIFVQIQTYLVDGLIRYENLMDDWWDVDEKSGIVRGQRSGTRIGIGDVVKTYIVRVDVARRELDLAISEVVHRARHGATGRRRRMARPKRENPKTAVPRLRGKSLQRPRQQ